VLCDELKINFSLSLVVKIESKLNCKIETITKNTVPPRGDGEWELVAPLILLIQILKSLL
jgi:hypothetical protein